MSRQCKKCLSSKPYCYCTDKMIGIVADVVVIAVVVLTLLAIGLSPN